LGGVHADSQPADAGVEVVTAKRSLPSFVKSAVSRQRQRVRRDDNADTQ
jgi:hypothetical protein